VQTAAHGTVTTRWHEPDAAENGSGKDAETFHALPKSGHPVSEKATTTTLAISTGVVWKARFILVCTAVFSTTGEGGCIWNRATALPPLPPGKMEIHCY